MKHSDFIENKQRGSRDLPIQLYRLDSNHPEYIMQLHWHREFEIIRVISGSFTLFVNNTPYTLIAGDIAFVNCKALHRGEPENCRYDCIVVDLNLLNRKGNATISSYVEPIINGELCVNALLPFDGSALYAAVNGLFNILTEKRNSFELAVMGSLYAIFGMLYDSGFVTEYKTSKRGAGQTAAISKLVEWIDENYTEQITLPTLAQRVGMTPNYLCRIFKEYTGNTPIEYVNLVRVEGVCNDIAHGQRNITTAAINNGYNDLSYFCKVFKKIKGTSAKSYAQSLLEEVKK